MRTRGDENLNTLCKHNKNLRRVIDDFSKFKKKKKKFSPNFFAVCVDSYTNKNKKKNNNNNNHARAL